MNHLGTAAANEDSPPSPCINICRMNPISDLCEGCLRTLDEIAQWSTASNSRKQAIWQQLRQRAKQLPPTAAPDFGNPGARDRR